MHSLRDGPAGSSEHEAYVLAVGRACQIGGRSVDAGGKQPHRCGIDRVVDGRDLRGLLGQGQTIEQREEVGLLEGRSRVRR